MRPFTARPIYNDLGLPVFDSTTKQFTGWSKRPNTFWEKRLAGSGNWTARGFWGGLRFGAEGATLGLPFIAFEVGMAQRGEVIPTAVARGIGLVTYPALNGLISGALGYAFPGMRLVGLVGGLLAIYPDSLIQDKLLYGVRQMSEAAKHVRQLETGGGYQDTGLAQHQRMQAITEMSGALGVSRRYLGQEASLMHR